MTPGPAAAVASPVPDVPRASRWILAFLLGSFWLVRGPVMFRQLPAQDEDYFAVPGTTILESGVPRIPYLPSRNPGSAFYRADEVLFALPPLYFYWEAAVYAILGPSTGTARCASALAGSGAILCLYWLGRIWLESEAAALGGAALYAWSRVIYFPCLVARPDMLCGLCGLLALGCASQWWLTGSRWWLIGAGAAIGAGLLTHPFALVFALQIGVWSLCRGLTWAVRFRDAALLTVVALAVFALWLPLIALDVRIFQAQFGNNVFHKSGPGLFSRLLLPASSVAAQWPLFLEHVGPLQIALLGSAFAALLARRSALRSNWQGTALCLAIGGMYLHLACQGEHPTKGYWVYTLAPFYLFAAAMLVRLAEVARSLTGRVWPGVGLTTLLACATILPGAGLRTIAAHLQHWNDINYDAPRFTRRLLDLTPSEGRQVVDPGYVFAFHLAGRDTLLALHFPFFYDVAGEPYDLLIAGPYSLRDGVPVVLEAWFERAVGDRDDLFACYAEIYAAPPERRPLREVPP